MADRDPFSLDAKYLQEEGAVFLSGIQGLVRVPLDQHRADRALVERALMTLDEPGYERAITLAALPDIIRGYEDVKLATVERFRQEVRALGV